MLSDLFSITFREKPFSIGFSPDFAQVVLADVAEQGRESLFLLRQMLNSIIARKKKIWYNLYMLQGRRE